MAAGGSSAKRKLILVPERCSRSGLLCAEAGKACRLSPRPFPRLRYPSFASLRTSLAFDGLIAAITVDEDIWDIGKDAEKLSVPFVSPCSICPPIHGGGVFMYQMALELAPQHVIATRDMSVLTKRLVESYRAVLREKRR